MREAPTAVIPRTLTRIAVTSADLRIQETSDPGLLGTSGHINSESQPEKGPSIIREEEVHLKSPT